MHVICTAAAGRGGVLALAKYGWIHTVARRCLAWVLDHVVATPACQWEPRSSCLVVPTARP